MAHRAINVCGNRNVLETALAKIVIEDVVAAGQAPRPAKDSNALPQTAGVFARGRGVSKVEVRIICDDQIELPIPIVIHEGAAASPSLSITGDACCVRHLFESAVAVVVEPVFPVVRDVNVVPAVVVVVADTHALTPAAGDKTSFLCNIGECSIVIVTIEMTGGRTLCVKTIEPGAIHEQYVRPAIVIVIEDGCSGASALEDVCAALFSSKYIARRKNSCRSDIYEVRDHWRLACCRDRLFTECMLRGKLQNNESSE